MRTNRLIELITILPDKTVRVRQATKTGFAIAEVGDSVNVGLPSSKTRRGRVGKGIANTLTCTDEMAVVVDE